MKAAVSKSTTLSVRLAGVALIACSCAVSVPPRTEKLSPPTGGDDAECLRVMASCDWTASRRESIEDMSKDEARLCLLSDLESQWTGTRVGAAELLLEDGRKDSHGRVKELLAARDICVRRAVVELLYGERALRPEMAERYRYAEALEAEKEVARLAGEIRQGDLRAQFRATQKLAKLGRPALWGIQRLIRDDKNLIVGLSAAYAQSQIANVPDEEWLAHRAASKRTLARQVSFPADERDLYGFLAALSKASGVVIDVSQLREWDYQNQFLDKTTLGFSRATLGEALDLLCRTYDVRHYNSRDGTTIVDLTVNWDGDIAHMIDVRDLEADGFCPNWFKEIDKASPDGDHRRRIMGEWTETMTHVPGFICMVARTHQGNADGMRDMAPVYEHLDGLRRERGMAPALRPSAETDFIDASLRPQWSPQQ